MNKIKSLTQVSDEMEKAFARWKGDPSNDIFSVQYELTVKKYTDTLEDIKRTLNVAMKDVKH